MKKLLFVLFSVMFSLSVFSQTKNAINLTEGNYYSCIIEDSSFTQAGTYIYLDGKLQKHGEWEMFSNGKLISKGVFEYNKIVYLETSVDGKWRKITRRDFEFVNKMKSWSTEDRRELLTMGY